MNKFKVGNKVEWESGAGRGWKNKVGTVVGIVPRGTDFYLARGEMNLEPFSYKSAYGGGMYRDHESYAVLVPHPGKGKPTLYWPRVSGLKLVNEK